PSPPPAGEQIPSLPGTHTRSEGRVDGPGRVGSRRFVPWAVAIVALLAAGLAGGVIIASGSSGRSCAKAASTAVSTVATTSPASVTTEGSTQPPAAAAGSLNENEDLSF